MEKYFMKKFFVYTFFSVCFVPFIFADDPSIIDLQSYFYGTWCYEETEMYYTISKDKLIAFHNMDNTGFTIIIDEWKYIINDNAHNSDYYPTGFQITGTVEEMTGSWWIEIGDYDTWVWFINIDKNILINYDIYGEYLFIKQ
jgi:hypothetical protein